MGSYKCVIVLKDGTIIKEEKDLIYEAVSWVKKQIYLNRIRNVDTIIITEVK